MLGRSNGWPGERWLDIRQLGVIEPIMTARFQMCREKGFDAVEPDNIEASSNPSGFPITAQQQLTFNEWVAEEAHSLGMAVLQKNDGEQSLALSPYFDGALSEQCNQYRECASFDPYLVAGKPVLNAEYRLATSRFCAADAGRWDHGRALQPGAQRQALHALPVGGAYRSPARKAASFAAIPLSIARLACSVALPRCGRSTMRGASSSRGETAGSPS